MIEICVGFPHGSAETLQKETSALDNLSDIRVLLADCASRLKASMAQFNDLHFMGVALEEAQKGARAEEVPIGAVLVLGGKVIARNHNRCLTAQDPTAHAEILVIREAAKKLRNYRLLGSVLYVTVEPCLMCVGAMIHARISRLVFGAPEAKTGMVESRLALLDDSLFNHRIETAGGVRLKECRQLVQGFFRERREQTMQPELCLGRSGDIPQELGPCIPFNGNKYH